ncbi:MAG: PilW family protein [Gemmatimonadota bacterium]
MTLECRAPGIPRRRSHRAGHASAGFTVVELLVSIVLFAIVSTGMYNLLISQNRFFDTQEAANATQQNTRIALKRVANDILLVGRGINTLSLDNPDVILPNDGSVPANTFQSGAITLLSIPDGVPQIPFAADAARGATSIVLVDDSLGVVRGLTTGDLIVIHDTNLNSSQMLPVTGTTDNGATVTVTLAAGDSLLAGYPGDFSRMYVLNSISYRLNTSDAQRPHLERSVDNGAWQPMVTGIEGLTFTYFNSASAQITPTSQDLRRQIRKVRLEIDGRSVRPIARDGTRLTFDLATEVTPRNMME